MCNYNRKEKKMNSEQLQELLKMRRRKTYIPAKKGKGSIYKRKKYNERDDINGNW